MSRSRFLTILPLFIVFMGSISIAKDYIIYSIVQSVPMGEENEIQKKNYYLTIGAQQGATEGTIVDVFRTLSRVDPYDGQKRYNYKVKIGELEVIHAGKSASIAKLAKYREGEKIPLFEVKKFIIGDRSKLKIK